MTVHSAHRVENFGEMDISGKSNAITKRDYDWMISCDIFIAFLPDENGEILRTDGTCVELGWASSLGKPIILLRGKSQARPLIDGLDAIATVNIVMIEQFIDDPSILLDVIDEMKNNISQA